MHPIVPIQRAMISVSNKEGLIEFAQFLVERQVQIFSTGGTAQQLSDHGIPNRDVAEYTGFPEMMSGRLKTLHPKVHGGLLGRKGIDTAVMEQHGIEAFDLLVVNLYPFEETVAQGKAYAECVEQIDIGGPAMIRSAAKNHQRVSVVVDVSDYPKICQAMEASKGIPFDLRAYLATKAFQRVARYDSAIAQWFEAQGQEEGSVSLDKEVDKAPLPEQINVSMHKVHTLSYGENPHQQAAFYAAQAQAEDNHFGIKKIQGKPISFNNIVDLVAAQNCCQEHGATTCVIVKHTNPCSVASAKDGHIAYQRALEADPISAFGGIIALNVPVDEVLAKAILAGPFVEAVIAPQITDGARVVFEKKPKLRVLEGKFEQDKLDYKNIAGGLLVQEHDACMTSIADLKLKNNIELSQKQMETSLFAWKIVRHVQSNAIVVANHGKEGCQTVGVGGGQTSRVDSVHFALNKIATLKEDKQNLVLASDAFFPFADSIQLAAQAGIKAIIQPGGSIKDEEVIAAATKHSIAMVFTGVRHFRH